MRIRRPGIAGRALPFVALLAAWPLGLTGQTASPAMISDRPAATEETIERGREIYMRSCVFCHGTKGTGRGPVSFFLSRDTAPHPRNFVEEQFKFRSTRTGELPIDEDLFRTITRGITGFMPPFGGLPSADRWSLVDYVKSLRPEFEEAHPQPLGIVGGPIPASVESVRRGRAVYVELKCWECHGEDGRGWGPSAHTSEDERGRPLPPTDLRRPSSFKRSHDPEDLYRTLMTGLNGTNMPGYSDILEGREIDAWHLINYMDWLSQE